MRHCPELYIWRCSVAETCAVMQLIRLVMATAYVLYSVCREENTVTTRATSEETPPHLLHCPHATGCSKCPHYFFCTIHSLNHLFSLFVTHCNQNSYFFFRNNLKSVMDLVFSVVCKPNILKLELQKPRALELQCDTL